MNFNKLNKIMTENKNRNLLEQPMITPQAGIPQTQVNVPQNGGEEAIKGNINLQRLLKFFPNQDAAKFKNATQNAIRGGNLSNMQLIVLGNAFIDLLKANPQETVQIMNLLKKVSIENN